MNNNELDIILSKIDDLKDFYDEKTDQLKEFYTATRLDMRGDVEEIKRSNKEVSEKLNNYTINHYAYHQREKKKFFKWIIISGIIILVLVFSGVGELLFPYIAGLAKLIWTL